MLVESWSGEAIRQHIKEGILADQFEEIFKESLPLVEIITENNRERLIVESETFRKTVRGEAVGSLG